MEKSLITNRKEKLKTNDTFCKIHGGHSFTVCGVFEQLMLRIDDHAFAVGIAGDLNEEDIHAARTLTLLGSARKNKVLEGESDASDARNCLAPGRTCFEGVCKLQKNVFMAHLKYKDSLLEIGQFEDLVHAAQAHDKVALGLLGNRAWTNFPPSTFTYKDIHEALARMQDRHPQISKTLLLNNGLNSPETEMTGIECRPFHSKEKAPGEVTRTGRIVRKPKRFQQGLSKMPVWGGPSCEWVASLECLKNEEKDQVQAAFYIQ